MLNFDFNKSELVTHPDRTSLRTAAPRATPITSRNTYMEDATEIDSVISRGKMYVFQEVFKGQPIIEGTAQSSTWWGGPGNVHSGSATPGSVFNAHMTCRPG